MRLYYQELAVVVQRGGKVAYSFSSRREMHSGAHARARREKSRHSRSMAISMVSLARWFMEPERKIGVASINQLGKIRRRAVPAVACAALPLVPRPVDLSTRTSNLRHEAFEFELNARIDTSDIKRCSSASRSDRKIDELQTRILKFHRIVKRSDIVFFC